MNAYIATTIFAELKEILQGCCRYSSRCSKICAASGTAVLLPIAFWLQFAATLTDEWVLVNSTSLDENIYFGCFTSAYEDSRCLCVLEITSSVILFLLMIIGFGVCCRTCCHSITLNSCKVCFVCIISLISLIPGMLSLSCCLVTVKFASDHKEKQLSFGFSFYAYTITGSATLLISLVSICGYICVKSVELRGDYETLRGSEDGDQEEA